MMRTVTFSAARSAAARWAPRKTDCQCSCVRPLGMTTIEKPAARREQPPSPRQQRAAEASQARREGPVVTDLRVIVGVRVSGGIAGVKQPTATETRRRVGRKAYGMASNGFERLRHGHEAWDTSPGSVSLHGPAPTGRHEIARGVNPWTDADPGGRTS